MVESLLVATYSKFYVSDLKRDLRAILNNQNIFVLNFFLETFIYIILLGVLV